MWEFSNLNSNPTFRAAGAVRRQKTMVYPSYENPCVSPCTAIPSPGFEEQGSFLHFSSSVSPRMSTPAPNPGNISKLDSAETKRLPFKRFRDEKIIVFSSAANPFDDFNPSAPPRNATSPHTSIEMHEDTEEIDALLYSESDYSVNEEESSTGHSPLDTGEEASRSYYPAKRLRLVDSTESQDLLADTASSGISPSTLFIPDDDHIDPSLSSGRKKEKIRATVSALRRIIPGGKGKDTASVLEEAIQYLKSLKLRAVAMGAISPSP